MSSNRFAIATIAALVLAGCAKKADVKTARDFVAEYNAATARRDYDAMWKFQAHDDGVPETRWKADAKRDFERTPPTPDEYVSEREEAGAIIVTVRVAGVANGEIVLVRQADGQLRMLGAPSRWIEEHRKR